MGADGDMHGAAEEHSLIGHDKVQVPRLRSTLSRADAQELSELHVETIRDMVQADDLLGSCIAAAAELQQKTIFSKIYLISYIRHAVHILCDKGMLHYFEVGAHFCLHMIDVAYEEHCFA